MEREHLSSMARALELAQKGRGYTGVNPMVGAVLVRDDNVIAEGFHAAYGKAHAERNLLEKNEQKISTKDIVYVSLEPCCHTKKKTPPCAQLLIERGIKNVVYGMKDPNPEVSGKGIELLQNAGVHVLGPVMQADCRRLNRGFVSLMAKGRPWITLKQAQTKDGRFANADGSPLAITSEKQNAWSHEYLRARHDAILIGVGTVLSDDPELNVRYGVTASPRVIVLDPTLKTPLTAKIVRHGTIIIASLEASSELIQKLTDAGARVICIPCEQGHFDWSSLWDALKTPTDDFHGISSILVEGGAKTWASFKEAGMIDEEVVLQQPLTALY